MDNKSRKDYVLAPVLALFVIMSIIGLSIMVFQYFHKPVPYDETKITQTRYESGSPIEFGLCVVSMMTTPIAGLVAERVIIRRLCDGQRFAAVVPRSTSVGRGDTVKVVREISYFSISQNPPTEILVIGEVRPTMRDSHPEPDSTSSTPPVFRWEINSGPY